MGAYTYRARNNNGRKFTVTQAYENKVSTMTSFGLVPAASTGDVKGSATGVNQGAIAPGADLAGTYNPGTYYNVMLRHATKGFGVKAAVTVTSTGITKIEFTAGGHTVVAADALILKCDTRIASALISSDATNCVQAAAGKIITVNVGATTVPNILMASLRVGAESTSIGSAKADRCDAGTSNTGETVVPFVANVGGLAGSLKINGVRMNTICAAGSAASSKVVVVAGGSTDSGSLAADYATMLGTAKLENSAAEDVMTFVQSKLNLAYYQVGFYDTTTPKFNRDGLHEGQLQGSGSLDSQMMTVMGGRTGTSFLYALDLPRVGVDNRQMFDDFNSLGSQGQGTGRRTQALRSTSSLVVGSQGDAITPTVTTTFQEVAHKYAYVGRGFDQLTVTPAPDEIVDVISGAASSTKMVVTYTGATGSCSVTEVDRGTHESSVCSGRGNCDTATGTCLCDAGYTLEACSEQTVLV